MSTIRLVQPSALPPGGPRLSLAVPRLRFLGRGFQQQTDQEVLRAVAAAVALKDPRAALDAVGDLRADDADLPALFDEITDALDPILAAVVHVQRDRTRSGAPSEEERVVADAVGVDPALVSAAAGTLKDAADSNAAIRSMALWVGLADLKLLEEAAGIGARRKRLGAILTGPTPTAMADLEKRIADNNQKLIELGENTKANFERLGSEITAELKGLHERINNIETNVNDIWKKIGP